MKPVKTYDVVILGAGSAGLSARSEVSKQTDNYLVINGGPMGTTCARVGCMPSKSLIEAAQIFHQSKKFSQIGVKSASKLRVDTAKLLRHVRSQRDHFVRSVHKDVEKWITTHFLNGYASFVDENILEVNGELIFAKKIIIATGSRPQIPRAFSAIADKLLTSDQFFEMKKLPKKIAVIGAGAIGLEIAQALAHLGVEVLVFGVEKNLSSLTDTDVSKYAKKHFKKEMKLITGQVTSVEKKRKGFKIYVNKETFLVEQVLLATGRVPNLEKLHLENLSLPLDDRGRPMVDPTTMRIEGSQLYIAGDVSGYRPVLHEAADEGRIAGQNALLEKDICFKRRTKLLITFTNPQIASVAQSLQQIKDSKIPFVMAEIDYKNQGRATTQLKNSGLIRVYAEKKKGELLGAEIFAPEGEHIAHYLAMAIDKKLSVFDLLSVPFYHPVLEEGLRTALRRLASQVQFQCPRFELARCNDAIVGS